MNPLLVKFVADFGMELGSRVLRGLSDSNQINNLSKIMKMVNENIPLQDAMKKVLGDQYDNFINKAKEVNGFVYEANSNDYIQISIADNTTIKEKVDLLRTEFNINLHSVNLKDKEDTVHSYALSVVKCWVKRYEEIVGVETDDENKRLKSLFKILDNKTVTYRDLYSIIRPILGVSSALSLIYAVLLFSAIHLGIMAKIALYLCGVPGGEIVGCVLLSTILAYLSTIELGVKTKVQAVINLAYKVLDDKVEELTMLDMIDDDKINKEINALIEKDASISNINQQSLLVIVGILKYIANIDGKVHDNEIKVYQKYMKEELLLGDKEIKDYWKKTPQIEGVESVYCLKDILTDDQKKNLVKTLKHIMIADGKAHKDEVKFINEVKKIFGV